MIGLQAVSFELGSIRVAVDGGVAPKSNVDRPGIDPGFRAVVRRRDGQEASDLCVLAAAKILAEERISARDIDCVVVVTQHPDGYGIPHVGSIALARLGVPPATPNFDVGLGGSGYVYGLSILKSFMQLNRLKRGLLLTADPISRVIGGTVDQARLTFGDAGTASLLTDSPTWEIGQFDFGNAVAKMESHQVRVRLGGRLHFERRAYDEVFIEEVPKSIQRALALNGVRIGDVDRVIVQQLNQPAIEGIGRALMVPTKTSFYASDYGETGSSSVPIALANSAGALDKSIVLCGFGAGLSWASTILRRRT